MHEIAPLTEESKHRPETALDPIQKEKVAACLNLKTSTMSMTRRCLTFSFVDCVLVLIVKMSSPSQLVPSTCRDLQNFQRPRCFPGQFAPFKNTPRCYPCPAGASSSAETRTSDSLCAAEWHTGDRAKYLNCAAEWILDTSSNEKMTPRFQSGSFGRHDH